MKFGLMRLTGDLAGSSSARIWGASGNAVAVGLFLLHMAGTLIFGNVRRSVQTNR